MRTVGIEPWTGFFSSLDSMDIWNLRSLIIVTVFIARVYQRVLIMTWARWRHFVINGKSTNKTRTFCSLFFNTLFRAKRFLFVFKHNNVSTEPLLLFSVISTTRHSTSLHINSLNYRMSTVDEDIKLFAHD